MIDLLKIAQTEADGGDLFEELSNIAFDPHIEKSLVAYLVQ